jgi:hypothetical protein
MTDAETLVPVVTSGAPLATPLTRLHSTARMLGITVVDAADADGPWLDDETAAIVACGVCIALSPGLDEDLRADVLAMALAASYQMSVGETGRAGDITAANIVVISRTRVADPSQGPGKLATVIAREHGRDTASAAFEYTVPARD